MTLPQPDTTPDAPVVSVLALTPRMRRMLLESIPGLIDDTFRNHARNQVEQAARHLYRDLPSVHPVLNALAHRELADVATEVRRFAARLARHARREAAIAEGLERVAAVLDAGHDNVHDHADIVGDILTRDEAA